MIRAAIFLFALALAALPAGAQTAEGIAAQPPETAGAPPAERVVAALSQNRVSLTTTFSGSEIFVFGAVKREGPAAEARLDVIVAVDGPAGPVIVRRKDRVAGIWTNTESVRITRAPSFYAVAATGPLAQVLSPADDLLHHIGIDAQVRLIDAPPEVEDSDAFREAVIRLRRDAGLYKESPRGVILKEETLFTASVTLPANLTEGDYRARVFLLHDGHVIDRFDTSIQVRKEGLERWVHALSRGQPLVYGLLSILLAVAAGWGASEIFRQLRR